MATTRPAKAAWSLLAMLLDEVVAAGAAAVVSCSSEDDVVLVDPLSPFAVLFVVPSVSWNTPPGTWEALANDELALRDVGGTYVLEASLVVVTDASMLLDDEVEVELCVVGIGVGEGLGVVATAACKFRETTTAASDVVGSVLVLAGSEVEAAVAVGLGFGLEELSSPVDPSVLKKMTLADPDVTVTTQKSAPPAPVADSRLLTPPKPSVLGSMLQGSPTQVPSHSILTPNLGFTPGKASV